jgi:hypothetical protein
MTHPFATRVEDTPPLITKDVVDDFVKKVSKKIRQSYPNDRRDKLIIIRDEFVKLRNQL